MSLKVGCGFCVLVAFSTVGLTQDPLTEIRDLKALVGQINASIESLEKKIFAESSEDRRNVQYEQVSLPFEDSQEKEVIPVKLSHLAFEWIGRGRVPSCGTHHSVVISEIESPELRYIVSTLPIGQLSRAIRTNTGYSIVRVIDRDKVDAN